MSDADVVIVKRIGSPLLYALGFLLCAPSLLLVLHSILHGGGWGRFFPYAALVCFVCLYYFLYKALPKNTVVDMKKRTVRIRPSGWRTKTIPFDDICDVRVFTRGEAVGYCLLLRADPLFDCVAISDPTTESAYTRELGLQVVPRIRATLADSTPAPAIPATARQTCFEQKGSRWERNLSIFPYALLLFPGLLLVILSDVALTEGIAKNIIRLLALLSCVFLALKAQTPLPYGFLPERSHVVEPANRTVGIFRGALFLRKSKTSSFDDLQALCISVKTDRKAAKSVYFRFKGDQHLHLIAHDTPDKLREILASYALVMGLDLSSRIEYVS